MTRRRSVAIWRTVWRSRWGALACVGVGLLLVAPLAGAAVADTGGGGGTGLGGYTMFANGNGLQILFDNPAGLGGSHPVGEVDIPEASATMETGPLGHALSTVFWPGSLLGNLGSASNVLPIPPQIAQLLKGANYPVRAEAAVPSGAADASYPGGSLGAVPIQMTAHADQNQVDSKASVTSFGIPGLLNVGSISGHGNTTLSATAATSTGTSSVGGIDILGGLVHIDAISSTATATSDGTTAKGSGKTIVGGVTAGYGAVPATIDNNGLHLGPSNTPLGGLLAPVNTLLNQALQTLNFNIKTLHTVVAPNGAQENVLAGGLVITYDVPASLNNLLNPILQRIPQVPNVLQGGHVTITLGGATADVDASPGFSDTGPPPDTGTVAPTPSVDTSGSGGTPGTPGTGPTSSGGIDTGTGGGFSAPALASAPKTSKLSPAPRNADAAPIGFFGGLSAGLIVLALAGAGLIGFGLIRLCLGGLNPAAMTICPLEPPS